GRSFGHRRCPVQPGETTENQKLVVGPPAELRLRVTGEDGRPVAGAALDWVGWKTDRSDWCWLPVEVLRRERGAAPATDRDGRLSLPGLPEGCVCQGRLRHPDFARAHFEGARPGGADAALRMGRGQPLTVVAVEAATGKPAREATVSLSGSPQSISVLDEP